jgi:hypothetical protein
MHFSGITVRDDNLDRVVLFHKNFFSHHGSQEFF